MKRDLFKAAVIALASLGVAPSASSATLSANNFSGNYSDALQGVLNLVEDGAWTTIKMAPGGLCVECLKGIKSLAKTFDFDFDANGTMQIDALEISSKGHYEIAPRTVLGQVKALSAVNIQGIETAQKIKGKDRFREFMNAKSMSVGKQGLWSTSLNNPLKGTDKVQFSIWNKLVASTIKNDPKICLDELEIRVHVSGYVAPAPAQGGQPAPVPVPGSLLLMSSAIAGLGLTRLRRRQASRP